VTTRRWSLPRACNYGSQQPQIGTFGLHLTLFFSPPCHLWLWASSEKLNKNRHIIFYSFFSVLKLICGQYSLFWVCLCAWIDHFSLLTQTYDLDLIELLKSSSFFDIIISRVVFLSRQPRLVISSQIRAFGGEEKRIFCFRATFKTNVFSSCAAKTRAVVENCFFFLQTKQLFISIFMESVV
jgi:hypothetical protein